MMRFIEWLLVYAHLSTFLSSQVMLSRMTELFVNDQMEHNGTIQRPLLAFILRDWKKISQRTSGPNTWLLCQDLNPGPPENDSVLTTQPQYSERCVAE
jgi:hypothetical protein